MTRHGLRTDPARRTSVAAFAVITTDHEGRVATMNAVAERLTGWTGTDAHHKPLEEVFRILTLGCRADAVANGQDALSALRSIPYDLVLIHCQMPVMDGFETTRQIHPQSAVRNHRVPVIAMTAHAIRGEM